MSSKVNFIYKLEGGFIDGIDMSMLFTYITSLTGLIQEANKILGIHPELIHFNIKSIQEGSMSSELVINSGDNAGDIDNLFGSFGGDITELLTIIGLVIQPSKRSGSLSGSAVSLFDLLKKLKGEKPEVTKGKGGRYDFKVSTNIITASSEIYNLFCSLNIYNYINKAFSEPIRNDICSKVMTICDNLEPLIIDKTFATDIYNISQINIDDNKYLNTRMQLIIESTALERLDWKFAHPFRKGYMKVSDPEFWEKYKRKEITIYLGDTMDCEIRTKIDGKTEEVLELELVKVHNVIPSNEEELFA